MSDNVKKQPPALVIIDGELFWEFDRWRTMNGYNLTEVEPADGWMLHLHKGRDDRDAE